MFLFLFIPAGGWGAARGRPGEAKTKHRLVFCFLLILAGAGPRPDVRKIATATHLYTNVHTAFDFGQPDALNPITASYLKRKTHDALDFG